MTPEQEEGCRLLAEMEGFDDVVVERSGDTWIWAGLEGFYRKYLSDWNDLHRVYDKLYTKNLSSKEVSILMKVSFDKSKEEIFVILVEAAKWIKQNKL